MDKIRLWLIARYRLIVSSIAFIPGIISILFLVFAILLLIVEFSEAGRQLKTDLPWLTLKDPSTARSILGTIAGGVISLTVFSFSMVMIVLNQAASQMSNRVLDKLIGNRFQQTVLGVYIGTIVYSFFLFSTIRDTGGSFQIPSISIITLTAITVFDIFLFIYFLHFITQSVKYDVVISRIESATFDGLKEFCIEMVEEDKKIGFSALSVIKTSKSGIFEGFDTKEIMDFCKENACSLSAIYPMGTFVLRGQPILLCSRVLAESKTEDAQEGVILSQQESVSRNYEYGLRQLSEIAIKALSPGINDPGTAIISLRALFNLLGYRAKHFPPSALSRNDIPHMVYRKELSFDELFARVIFPIWDYGKEDRMLQQEFQLLLGQLSTILSSAPLYKLLKSVEEEIDQGDLS
ncbi:DUF2254 domain-containing protein [Aquiflexum gelatinilyticum]|uniref:DUF2254 domain-containing protein n=1 Tax=Aquiflexum gelatinilyticum TaxID=2961943 RepID=A0A9X2P240_9BACT|nr:DUF2254 domain-containing protein [Aquiflexum gelatinilyticum]MCR9013913.1 DUF2254 domain-containing protein [Aquiflexum gelatinilyticum]